MLKGIPKETIHEAFAGALPGGQEFDEAVLVAATVITGRGKKVLNFHVDSCLGDGPGEFSLTVGTGPSTVIVHSHPEPPVAHFTTEVGNATWPKVTVYKEELPVNLLYLNCSVHNIKSYIGHICRSLVGGF